MNRWAKIVLALTALAAAAWIGTGVYGFRVADDATLTRHTLVSFLALVTIVLGQGWIAVFAALSPRLVASATPSRPELVAGLRRVRRWAVSAAVVAVLAVLAQFVVANALYSGRLDARTHALAGALSAALLLASTAVEGWALARHGRAVDAARE